MPAASRVDVFITEKVLKALERGDLPPWRRTWWPGQAPANVTNHERPYRGGNPFLLMMANFECPWWVTLNQLKGLGGRLKPDQGRQWQPIVFYKRIEKEEEDEEGNPVVRTFWVLRYWRVYNVLQTQGVPKERIPPYGPEARRDHDPIQAAERILAGMRSPPRILLKGVQPRYLPRADTIEIPRPQLFESDAEYYAALFHELGHASGHPDRLGRFRLDQGASLEGYSKEELVAEFAAAFLCGEAGIALPVLENAAAYLRHWSERLRADPRLFVRAAAEAQKAVDHLLGRTAQDEPVEEDRAA